MKEQTNGERFEEFMNSIDNYPELDGTINLCTDMINKRKTGKMTEEEWVAAERGNMTAIQQMIDFINNINDNDRSEFNYYYDHIMEKLNELLEVEKQQIIDAFEEGSDDGFYGFGDSNKEKYYNETYGSNKGV